MDIGTQLLRRALAQRPAPLVSAAALPAEALVVHVGIIGAPDVIFERLLDPADLGTAVEAVLGHLGRSLDAVGAIEIGGLNALIAVLAAAHLEVPLVDGDLMGRAFPDITKTSAAVRGHAATPLALVSPSRDTVLIPTASKRQVTRLVAATVAAMGGAAALALYPMQAAAVSRDGVAASVSACHCLGETYLTHRAGESRLLIKELGGTLLFEGRVDQIVPRGEATPGSITLTDARADVARVDFFDELVAVTVNGRWVASTPDVIAALNTVDHLPLRSDQIRLGQTLVVLSLPTLHPWPATARSTVGPAGYGLDLGGGDE